MLEEHVAYYLQRYLGNYVKGLSKEALKISAWQGNVELTNMQLKPEALNALKLPIKVKSGFLGSVKLKVPWSRLGKEPVVVLLDRIFVLAEPQTTVGHNNDPVDTQEAKSRKIKEMEEALLDANLAGTDKAEMNKSWLGSLISTIIGNLKLSITNIHIRYEDSESNVGHPFAIGMTLKKLAAVTVDDDGKEAFITSGPLDRIQKAAELEGLAVYLDPDVEHWKPEQPWENLLPAEWDKWFEPGIRVKSSEKIGTEGTPCLDFHYLLQPVGASASYKKLGSGDKRTKDQEMQKAIIRLDDVTLSFSQAQYRDILNLAENFSSLSKRFQYAHIRPTNTVKGDPKSWWKYVYAVTAEQLKKSSGRLSWNKIVEFAQKRKKYLSSYISCLQSNPNLTTCDNEEIRELERDLDVDVAVQWRMLAHQYVYKSRESEYKNKKRSGRGWLSFLWGNQSFESNEPHGLTEEDWKQLNQVIGYEEGNQISIVPGQDPPDMLHTVLEVYMQHNATKLVDDDSCNIIVLSAEQLQCNAKFYGEMKIFNFNLGLYHISSPEGLLAESEKEQEAITGEFIYMPVNRNVDWDLSVKASPCYITYLKSSITGVTDFFQNSEAASQRIALETAAAFQMTLDEMTRSAQQQLNEALKQKPRFSLCFDIAAPKIIVPSEFYPDDERQSKLLLDLGHLTLQTEDLAKEGSLEERDLYLSFKVGLSDVQVFLVDGAFKWREHYSMSHGHVKLKFQDDCLYMHVLDRCGIHMQLQQICVPHPGYPATRLSLRLPSLGFHFSPARYHRLMQILTAFQSTAADEQTKVIPPWVASDFEGELDILNWKGIGNREAVWQHKYAALAGPFLYILDSPASSSYNKRVSLFGKHVHVVPPGCIGNAPNVLSLCDASSFSTKVAESTNSILLRFGTEESRDTWQGRLQGAIYSLSSPAPTIGAFTSQKNDPEEDHNIKRLYSKSVDKEQFFLVGVLDELKIMISCGSTVEKKDKKNLLSIHESPLVELRALGSKVEFVMRQYDMSIGAVLQAFEVENQFYGIGKTQLRYLACSQLDFQRIPKNTVYETDLAFGKENSDKNELFYDTEEELEKSEHASLRARSSLIYYDAESGEDKDIPKFVRMPNLLPDLASSSDGVPKDDVQENFVKAQVIIFSVDSPAYKNIDKQITLSLATLSFFCIRPTIMALLSFADAITADVTAGSQDATSVKDEEAKSANVGDNVDLKAAFNRKDSTVRGLLGSGKDRILFSLVLNMRHAAIVLNTENGGHMASLDQEDLSCKIEVFPSSFAISASLGNLKICDGNVAPGSPYAYICDTRNPESTSFIQLNFCSFNKDDNDYEGYEYSLVGKLSEIRFVYLNRFIQEISAYFMELSPQSPEYIVKIDNKVTDVEKLFTQSEVEGSPAIKLDISLSKPILILPRNTYSKDFLELDVLHIKVTNSIKWIGGQKDDPAAVRLDTVVLQVEDIHLTVGINGESGEGIINKADGLSLSVTRTLRDLWHQVPAIDATIKIEELKADLSDSEYQVITECALSNLAEKANLLPPVKLEEIETKKKNESGSVFQRHDLSANKSPHADIQKTNDRSSSSNEGSWVTIVVSAEIDLVELRLFNGSSRDQALATAQVNGIWLAYKGNSNDESIILSSLKSLSLRDDREGTDPILQYMIGKADDMEYQLTNPVEPNDSSNTCGLLGRAECCSPMTMLILDAKLSLNSQVVSLRVQRPKLLVAIDFLLEIAEFFVPSLRSAVSDSTDAAVDSFKPKVGIHLDQPVFIQQDREMTISPRRPLVVNNMSIDDYIYDGNGGYLRLQNEDGSALNGTPKEPLIILGSAKSLRFKNVTIQNGKFIDSCILLGPGSCYTISEADSVFLQSLPAASLSESNLSEDVKVQKEPHQTEGTPFLNEIIFDLQAVGPELTFYDSANHHGMQQAAEKLIRARMDLFSRFIMRGNDMELNAKMKGLTIEASSGPNVIEPVDAEMKYSSVSEKTDVHLIVSDVIMNFSFSVLKLVLRLEEDISSFLRITSRQTTVQCYQFDKVWTYEVCDSKQRVTFWRARPPPGFATLGDCVTPSNEPLAKGILAVNTSVGWFKRPVNFKKVWSSSPPQGNANGSCSIWEPIPPPGYVTLGCIVKEGIEPPTLTSVVCVMERAVVLTSWMDCIYLPRDNQSNLCFWRVDNTGGSFFVENETKIPFELLYVASSLHFPKSQEYNMEVPKQPSTAVNVLDNGPHVNNSVDMPSRTIVSGVSDFENVSDFNRIWCTRLERFPGISIWRPRLQPGLLFFGDIAVQGFQPPNMAIVLRKQCDNASFKKALYFERVGHVKQDRKSDEVYFWYPVAPAGYAALGCVTTRSNFVDADVSECFQCVRNDIVVPTYYGGKLGELLRKHRSLDIISIWPVKNEFGTFIARQGGNVPPQGLAFCLADSEENREPDKIVVDAKLHTLSAAVYDDFRGLLTPLLNLSLTRVNVSSHGRMDALQSVLNFSTSALTYNSKCYAWEPLIEPFDAVLRYNQRSTQSSLVSGPKSLLRVVSTSSLNANVSVRNLNMLLAAYDSWNALSELLESLESSKQIVMAPGAGSDLKKPALDFKRKKTFEVLYHNKLGEDLRARYIDTSGQLELVTLPSGSSTSVQLPIPDSVLDQTTKYNKQVSRVHVITVLLHSAEIQTEGVFGGQRYMATVRILPRFYSSDAFQLNHQTARSRCVIPENSPDSSFSLLKWDEGFTFEVENEVQESHESCKMEITVKELTTGLDVGYCIFDVSTNQARTFISHGESSHPSVFNMEWKTLTKGGSSKDKGQESTSAKVFYGVYVSPILNGGQLENSQKGIHDLRSGMIQISYRTKDCWTEIGLDYASSITCWVLDNDKIVTQTTLDGSRKQLTFRSMVVVTNMTIYQLDMALLMRSEDNSSTSKTSLLKICTLEPNESGPLPVSCLRSNNDHQFLRFQPYHLDGDEQMNYGWCSVAHFKMHSEPIQKQKQTSEISIHSMLDSEELTCSSKEEGSSSENQRKLWFFIDVKSRERSINAQLESLQDWQIVVTAPLILYNYLPAVCEFKILEKSSGSGFIVRHRGLVEPGKDAQIYNVDVRQPLYLIWTPQGGWQPDDMPALVSHPTMQGVKFISLRNYVTKRLLNVFLDHSDPKESMSRRVRLYVPCWLDVKNLPPIHCNFTEVKSGKTAKVGTAKRATLDNMTFEIIQHDEMGEHYSMISKFSLDKMGLSVALAEPESPCFEIPKPLEPLNQTDGFVELKALNETGSNYYKIFASTKLCPYQSIPTKVLLLRPYITFTNRLGENMYLKQTASDNPKTLHPYDWRVTFPKPESDEAEAMQVRLADTDWSLPFSIMHEETLYIAMNKSSNRTYIKVEIRGYEEGSRFLVVFRRGSSFGPYRLENHVREADLQYRQQGLGEYAWQSLRPCSSKIYAWDCPSGEQLIEVLIVQENFSNTILFNINKIGKQYPTGHQSSFGVYCEVLEAGSAKIVKFCQSDSNSNVVRLTPAEVTEVNQDNSTPDSEMELQVQLGQFGVSMVDIKLRELIYLCMKELSFTYATGYARHAQRIEFLLGHLQLDNQLPLTILPVILIPEGKHSLLDPVLEISVKISGEISEVTDVYNYIGVQVTKDAWRVNIHEPVIWALLDFYNDLNIGKTSATSDVSQVDPEVKIDLLDVSEARLKLTLETAPGQRPRGMLGIWSPIITTLGNTSRMPIHLRRVNRENRYIRQSAIVPSILDHLRRDLIHNPLILLTGVDVLGMASSTLATLSETVAVFSTDGRFLQLRSNLDRGRRITGVGDGLVQGTEAVAHSVAFGVAGVIKKPIEQAREKGFIGFIQGLGKAAVGIVTEPMSGMLDFVSLTVDGIGASWTRCFDNFQRNSSYDRVRLPRYLPPDGVLHTYDEIAARGQFIMQLAEAKGHLHKGTFREPSKFAWSDLYVEHFNVVDDNIVMITTKRVMLLQPTKHYHTSEAKEPIPLTSIKWDVPWENLMAVEIACSANEQAPVYVVLHLRGLATFAHLIKCSSKKSDETISHTKTVTQAISKAWRKYGPTREYILQEVGARRSHKISSTRNERPFALGSINRAADYSEDQVDNSSSAKVSDMLVVFPNTESVKEIFNFCDIWTSEKVSSVENVITIWRPVVPDGYVSVGDIAHPGKHPPLVSVSYRNIQGMFTRPAGYDLVWRSWNEGFARPVSIWIPRAQHGYIALGCVAVAGLIEPELNAVWCVHTSLVEDASFEEQEIWRAPEKSAWGCFLYQVASEALNFIAVRQAHQRIQIKPTKVVLK